MDDLTRKSKESYKKYAQKKNLEVKQIFVQTLLQQDNDDFEKIATFLV
jgi:hypothetical protein